MSWTCRMGFVATFALLVCGVAAARAGNFGAYAGVSTLSPCPSFCGGSGSHFDSSAHGGEGFHTAATNLSNVDGFGTAAASLSGPTLLPVLGVLADSNPNALVNSQGMGYQAYLYVGAVPTSIDVDLVLEGSATAPANGGASGRASVAVIKGDDLPFSTHYATLVYETVPGDPDLDLLGTLEISLPVNVGDTSVTGSIPINLAPGDKFFVWASLFGSAVRDGVVDADNTLTLQFSNSSGITPVPEPSTGYLLLLNGLMLRRSWVRRAVQQLATAPPTELCTRRHRSNSPRSTWAIAECS